MGPGQAAVDAQIAAVEALGGVAVAVKGTIDPAALTTVSGFDGAIYWGDDPRAYAEALSLRDGAILPLITALPDAAHVAHERHMCVDTTAAG